MADMDKYLEKKKWHSLTQLKDFINEKIKDEHVVEFTGLILTTNRAHYLLDQNGLKVVLK